jgi:hypothetical protein
LTPGRVYFTVEYLDEDMRLPSIDSYVYLGAGLGSTADPNTHFFQTVDSFHSDGNWAALTETQRGAFDLHCLLTCDAGDLEHFEDAEQLRAHLAQLAARGV